MEDATVGVSRAILSLCLSVFMGLGVRAQAEDEGFSEELERINERYKDFFEHDKQKAQTKKERLSGVPDLKVQRQEYMRERERVRREYILGRKAKPDTSALEAQHEAEKLKQKKVHEQYGKDYAKRQRALKQVRKSARQIPENRDAGLED